MGILASLPTSAKNKMMKDSPIVRWATTDQLLDIWSSFLYCSPITLTFIILASLRTLVSGS